MDNLQPRARTLSCPDDAQARAPSPASNNRRASYCETPSLADRRRSSIPHGELPWHTVENDKHGSLAKLKRDLQRLHQGTDIPRFSPEIFECQKNMLQRGNSTKRAPINSVTRVSESLPSRKSCEGTGCHARRAYMSSEDKLTIKQQIKTLLRTASELVDSAHDLAKLLNEPFDNINLGEKSASAEPSTSSSRPTNLGSCSSSESLSTAPPRLQPGPLTRPRSGSSRCHGSMFVTTKDAISPATIVCTETLGSMSISKSSKRAARPSLSRYATASSLPTSRHASVRPKQRRYHSNGDRRAKTFDLHSIDSGGSEDSIRHEPTSPIVFSTGTNSSIEKGDTAQHA